MRNTIDVSLSWLFTQYGGHQRQRELRLFTCFTIVMIGRGHSSSILFTFTFPFYMVTVCLCIYKLCCSSMFPTISSVLQGDCRTQRIPSPFISASRFQVCCLARPKLIRNKMEICVVFFLFFVCAVFWKDAEQAAVNEALASSCMWDECLHLLRATHWREEMKDAESRALPSRWRWCERIANQMPIYISWLRWVNAAHAVQA